MEPNERDREAARDVVNQIGVQTDIMQGLHDGDIESIAQVFAQAREEGRREGLEQAIQAAIDGIQVAMMDLGRPDGEYLNMWGRECIRVVEAELRALIEKVAN